MANTFSTSNTFVEILPNAGYKEIIIETPAKAEEADTITMTLEDHGIEQTGLLSVSGFNLSDTYGVIAPEDPVTSVTGGVLTLTISSGTVAVRGPSKRVYRVIGKSA